MLTVADRIKTDKKCAACGGYEKDKPLGVYMFDAEPPVMRFVLCEKHAKLFTEGSPAAKGYIQGLVKYTWYQDHYDPDDLDRLWYDMLPAEKETWTSTRG
jgi:hypothetical protein